MQELLILIGIVIVLLFSCSVSCFRNLKRMWSRFGQVSCFPSQMLWLLNTPKVVLPCTLCVKIPLQNCHGFRNFDDSVYTCTGTVHASTSCRQKLFRLESVEAGQQARSCLGRRFASSCGDIVQRRSGGTNFDGRFRGAWGIV